MEKLISDKLSLPTVYFITDRSEIKELPIGVPFIYGDESTKPKIIRLLEYEMLYQQALKSGYPFNFIKLLRDAGFKDLYRFGHGDSVYLDYVTTELVEKCEGSDFDIEEFSKITESSDTVSEFIKDSSVYVDIQKLKNLKIFPIWLDKLEDSVVANIHTFATFNPYMYNKRLEGMYGSIDLTPPPRNLIIIDISGSIPRGVSATCLALAKNLATNFYADILITGSRSTLYPNEELYRLDIDTIYDENGMDNDQIYFKELVTSTERHYKTAIVYGDDHSPCGKWNGTNTISREDGKSMCRWTVDKLISFHTKSPDRIAGYADWFEPKEVVHIKNWVKYLDS